MIRQISLKPKYYLWAPQKPFLIRMGFLASTDNVSFTFEDDGKKPVFALKERKIYQ